MTAGNANKSPGNSKQCMAYEKVVQGLVRAELSCNAKLRSSRIAARMCMHQYLQSTGICSLEQCYKFCGTKSKMCQGSASTTCKVSPANHGGRDVDSVKQSRPPDPVAPQRKRVGAQEEEGQLHRNLHPHQAPEPGRHLPHLQAHRCALSVDRLTVGRAAPQGPAEGHESGGPHDVTLNI